MFAFTAMLDFYTHTPSVVYGVITPYLRSYRIGDEALPFAVGRGDACRASPHGRSAEGIAGIASAAVLALDGKFLWITHLSALVGPTVLRLGQISSSTEVTVRATGPKMRPAGPNRTRPPTTDMNTSTE